MSIPDIPEHIGQIGEDVDQILGCIIDPDGLCDKKFRENLIARLKRIELRRAQLVLPPWTFNQRLVFAHERYLTRALWKDKIRKSGEPYDYSHLDGSGDIAVDDMSMTGLATHLGIMKHDDVEDHERKFRGSTGQQHFEKVLLPKEYEHFLRQPVDVNLKDLRHDVSNMVRGVTNAKIDDNSMKAVESFRTLVDSMYRYGVRSVIVRLAERCHNMATLGAKSLEDQQRIAQNTFDVMAPMARLLKLRRTERRLLQDALAILNPTLKSTLEQARDARLEVTLDPHRAELLDILKPLGLVSIEKEELCDFMEDTDPDIPVNKLTLRDLHIPEAEPLYTVRILTKTRSDIYHALGILDHLLGSGAGGSMEPYTMPATDGPFQRGAMVRVASKRFDATDVKVNDATAHYRKDRGVLANYKENMAPEIRASAERFLLLTKPEMKLQTVVDLAHEKLFERMMRVYKKDGTPMDIPEGSNALSYATRLHGALLVGFRGATAEKKGASPRKLGPLDEILPGEKVVVDSCIQPAPRGSPPNRACLEDMTLDLRHLLLVTDDRTRALMRSFFRKPDKFVDLESAGMTEADYQAKQGGALAKHIQLIFGMDEERFFDILQDRQEFKRLALEKENRKTAKAHAKSAKAAKESSKSIPKIPAAKEMKMLDFSNRSAVLQYICAEPAEVLTTISNFYHMRIKLLEDTPKGERPTIRFLVHVELPDQSGTIDEFIEGFTKQGINKGKFNSWEDREDTSHVRFEVNDPTGRKSMQDFMLAFLKLSLRYPQCKVTLPAIERKSSGVGSLLRRGRRILGGGKEPDAEEDKK